MESRDLFIYFLVGMMITGGMLSLLHNGVGGLWSGEESGSQQYIPSWTRKDKKGRATVTRSKDAGSAGPPPV